MSRYPRKWKWPGGAKIAVSINLALEAFLRASQVTLEKTDNKIDHFSLTYAEYGAKSGAWTTDDFVEADRYFAGAVTLPLFPTMTYQEVDRVVDAVGDLLG